MTVAALRFLRFLGVGAIGFVVDAGGTWWLIRRGVPPLAARIAPLAAAIVCTWALNRRLTFRTRRPRSRAEFARYAAVALTGALLNDAFYSALVLLGMEPVPAIAVASGVVLFYSFFAYRFLVFR